MTLTTHAPVSMNSSLLSMIEPRTFLTAADIAAGVAIQKAFEALDDQYLWLSNSARNDLLQQAFDAFAADPSLAQLRAYKDSHMEAWSRGEIGGRAACVIDEVEKTLIKDRLRPWQSDILQRMIPIADAFCGATAEADRERAREVLGDAEVASTVTVSADGIRGELRRMAEEIDRSTVRPREFLSIVAPWSGFPEALPAA